MSKSKLEGSLDEVERFGSKVQFQEPTGISTLVNLCFLKL